MISPEVFGVVSVPLRGKDSTGNLPLRGVAPLASQLRKHFTLVEGRLFKPGKTELIVGSGASKQFIGLNVGSKVRWLNTDWQVVGRFTDDGGLAESEVWADAPVVQQAWQRGPVYQTVRAKVAEGSTLKALKDTLSKDPRFSVDVMSEKQFYADQQKAMSNIINRIGLWIGIIMGLAALFAALNTLESAVASRVREIATLRAMGFGAGPVVTSVLVEAMIPRRHRWAGGRVVRLSVLNGITSSALIRLVQPDAYAFTVTLLMLLGIGYGLLLCLLAGILPGSSCTAADYQGLRELLKRLFSRMDRGAGTCRRLGVFRGRRQRVGRRRRADSVRVHRARVPWTACSIHSSQARRGGRRSAPDAAVRSYFAA